MTFSLARRAFAAIAVLSTILPLGIAAQHSAPLLGPVFQDHTVLQRDAPSGFELCGSAPGTCRYADARIDGHRILLQA